MDLNASGESNGSLEGRKQFLEALTEMSSKVSTMDKAVLLSFDSKGKVDISSFGFHPLELAATLDGISKTIRDGVFQSQNPEEALIAALMDVVSAFGDTPEELDNSEDDESK
mgnify:FL=1